MKRTNENPFHIPLTLKTLQTFAEGGDGGGDNGGGTGGQGGGSQDNQNQPFAVFPDQKSFDARLDREARSKMDVAAKAAGFESYDGMMAAAKAKADADKAAMTETEKLKAEKETAEKAATDARTYADKILIDTKIEVAAIAAGAVKPEQVVALIDRAGIKLDNGQLTGVKEAMDAFSKENSHLFGQTKPGGTPGSPGNGGRQDGGGGTGAGDYGKRLAEQNKATTTTVVDGQKHYFG